LAYIAYTETEIALFERIVKRAIYKLKIGEVNVFPLVFQSPVLAMETPISPTVPYGFCMALRFSNIISYSKITATEVSLKV